MKITDKYRDYYDFHSHVYGVDNKVRFDRRGSVVLNNSELIEKSLTGYRSVFGREHISDSYLILEIGFTQYIIKVTMIKETVTAYSSSYTGNMEIIKTFRDNKHYYESPVSIRGCELTTYWKWKGGMNHKIINLDDSYVNLIDHTFKETKLLILKDTDITGLIDSFSIWSDIQTYISSLNNDKTVDNMTDKERIDSHGFDKHSFRS